MRTPVPPLELQEAENPNAISVSAPDVIHGYNTNTAPEMSREGPDFSGLQRGVGSIAKVGEEYESQQANLWALNQASKYNIAMHQELSQAEANGTPVNMGDFDARWQKQADEVSKGAFDSMAADRFLDHSFGLRARAVDRGLNIEARQNLKRNDELVTQTVNATLAAPGDYKDKLDTLQNMNGLVKKVAPGASNIIQQGIVAATQQGITSRALEIGANPAAAEVEMGKYNLDALSKNQISLDLRIQGQHDDAVGVSVAEQKYRAMVQGTIDGDYHSPSEWVAAEQNVQRAKDQLTNPVGAPAPDIIDRLNEIRDESDGLVSKYADDGHVSAARALQRSTSLNMGLMAVTGIRTLPLADQEQKALEIKQEFNSPEYGHVWASLNNQLKYARKALGAVNAKDADYAGYVNANRDVHEAFSKYWDAAQAGQPGAGGLFTLYKEKSFAAQHEVGIPAGSEMIVPKEFAEQLRNTMPTDESRATFITKTLKNLGDADGKQVIGEVFGGPGVSTGALKTFMLNPADPDLRQWIGGAQDKGKVDPKEVRTMNALVQNNPTYQGVSVAMGGGTISPQQFSASLGSFAAYLRVSGKASSDQDAVNMAIQKTVASAYIPVRQQGKWTMFPTDTFKDTADVQQHITDAETILSGMMGSSANDLTQGDSEDYQALNKAGLKTPWFSVLSANNISGPHMWKFDDKTKTLTFNMDQGGGMAPVRLSDGRLLRFSLDGLKQVMNDYKQSGAERGDLEYDPFFHDASHLDQLIPKDAVPQAVPLPQSSTQTPSPGKPVSFNLPAEMEKDRSAFVKAEQETGVPANLLAAISMVETGRGKSAAYRNSNNAMGISDDNGPVGQPSTEASILRQARELANGRAYAAWRKTGDLEDLAKVYAPPGASNDKGGTNSTWAASVASVLKEISRG